MRSHRSRFIALLSVAALGLVACGGDDGGSDDASTDGAELTALERQYADVIAAEFADDSDPDDLAVSADEAECMAVAMMSNLGADVFKENGVEPEDFGDDEGPGELLGAGVISEDDASAVVDEWLDCADLTGQLAAQMNEDFELDAGGLECLEREMEDSGFVHETLVLTFTSDEEEPPASFIGQVTSLLETCSAESDGPNPVVRSMAESLEGSGLSAEAANCLAQRLLDEIGLEGMVELSEAGDFSDQSAEIQAEFGQVMVAAAAACDVPLSDLAG
ncbi:MAG: hypothetical protein M3Z03_16515 [Actinomycetota bacterium]|nr:hypothetical protein [Actinomycetota bacterium]